MISIADFITHSECQKINNLALMMEKVLNDKIVLTDIENDILTEIMSLIDSVEKKAYFLSVQREEVSR